MIRLANTDDVVSINEIYNQAVLAKHQTATLKPISVETQIAWLADHDIDKYPVFVMEQDQKVVGWCSLSAYRKGREALASVAEISYYLHTAYQGQGLGTTLMQYAIKTAPHFGFKTLIAVLFGHNAGSIKLLKKFGFERWGTMPQTAIIEGVLYDHCYYGLKLKD